MNNTAAFIDIVEEWYRSRGMKQGEFAALVGTSPYHMNAVLRGRAPMREDFAKKVCDATGIDFSSYYTGTTGQVRSPAMNGYVEVPLRDASGSMGPGSFESSRKIKSYLSFREEWAHAKGNPQTMSVIRAIGTSMLPTIPDGCFVLIDESQRIPRSGSVYYVRNGEGYQLKRLRQIGQAWVIESDADGSRWEISPDDDFEILGRALWYGCEL